MQVIVETRSVPKSQGNIYVKEKEKKKPSLNRVCKKYWNTYWIFKVNITLFEITRSFRSRIPKPFILSLLYSIFFYLSLSKFWKTKKYPPILFFYFLQVKINFSNSRRKQKKEKERKKLWKLTRTNFSKS